MFIKIGSPSSSQASWRDKFAQLELRRIGVESTLVQVENPAEAILRGDADVAVQPLSELPLTRPEGVVVTAVSSREYPGDVLVMRPEALDNRLDFGLAHSAAVLTTTPWQAAQLRDFRPDLGIAVSGGTTFLDDLHKAKCVAVVLPAAVLEGMGVSGLEVVPLNPREFVPAPGQGVVAWLAHHDDLPVRRLLKQVHHPDVSSCTNVERRVLQLLGGDAESLLGAFVERDAAGNFHAFVAYAYPGGIRRTRLSQSTNFELAERVVERLL